MRPSRGKRGWSGRLQTLDKAQDAMAEKRFEAAKGHATHAAAQSRALLPTGAVEADDLQLAITSAGQAWELARTAAEQAVKDRRGRPTEMMDQHQLPHWNNGAFCGIAVMIMMLRANGMEQGSSTADLDALARRVYISGKGTSGSAMSGVLRERGIQDSRFTTTGTQATLIQSLEKGQTVPFGVTSVEGTVTKLEGGSSHRYNRRVGDPHQRKFRGAGHWVLVTGYEGTPERPTAFFVNDPIRRELRCTPMQISRMGEGSGSFTCPPVGPPRGQSGRGCAEGARSRPAGPSPQGPRLVRTRTAQQDRASRPARPGPRPILEASMPSAPAPTCFIPRHRARLRRTGAGPHRAIQGSTGTRSPGCTPSRALEEGIPPLRGRLIVVPVMNPAAYRARERTAKGGLDLNRCFPGTPTTRG